VGYEATPTASTMTGVEGWPVATMTNDQQEGRQGLEQLCQVHQQRVDGQSDRGRRLCRADLDGLGQVT
jgi:hypothetical protein